MTLKEQLFKLHPWQEEFLKRVDSGKKFKMYQGRLSGRKSINDYITNVHLTNMKVDQTFGLVTPEGIRIFRLEEIRK